jgi:hypothetical protein
MKLTKEKLRQIIKEELSELMAEENLEEVEDKKSDKKNKKPTFKPKEKKIDPFDPSRYEDGEYRLDYEESDREKDYD